MAWKNIKIGKKLAISFGSICTLLIVLLTLSLNDSINIIKSAESSRDKSLKFALMAKEIQIHVIQTQQWLTDISATRAERGYDDGFKEAEIHAEQFHNKVNEFKNLFENAGEQERLTKINTLEKSYDEFYELGIKMAQSYIEYGPERGNQLMADFDPFASKITEQTSSFVNDQIAQLNTSLTSIILSSNSMKKDLVIFTGIIILISILISIILTIGISTPLKKCLSTAQKISENDLNTHIDLDQSDEFGDLANALNKMSTNLKGTMEELSSHSKTISAAAEEFSITSNEMSETATEVSSVSSEAAAATVQMNQNIERVTDNARNLEESINSIATAIEEMSASLREVSENAANGSNIAEEVDNQTKAATETMHKMNASTKDIGKFLEIISNIAEQTNLLALNATIEAASAGEAGKGFAVVANEVKELAKQSSSATEEISQKTEEMLFNAKESVAVIENIANSIETLKTAALSIASAVEEQTYTINEIAQNTNISSGASSEIAEQIQKVSDATKEIANHIQQVSDSSIRNASGAAQTNISAEELAQLATRHKEILDRFKL